jgi:hypothetical protein
MLKWKALLYGGNALDPERRHDIPRPIKSRDLDVEPWNRGFRPSVERSSVLHDFGEVLWSRTMLLFTGQPV